MQNGRMRITLLLAMAVALVLPAHARSGSPDFPATSPLDQPLSIRATPGWQSACILRQDVHEPGRETLVSYVSFDTRIESSEHGPLLIQVVRGRGETPNSKPTFGYEHRLLMGADGKPIAVEARAIEGFPIDPDTLREAAVRGRVDIRDAVFSGRTFAQDDKINDTIEATFRFLKPVLPADTRIREIVDHEDRSRVLGIATDAKGRAILVVEIAAGLTAVRRSGVHQVYVSGWLTVDAESGLISGEDWSARVVKTQTEPFELETKITCRLGAFTPSRT